MTYTKLLIASHRVSSSLSLMKQKKNLLWTLWTFWTVILLPRLILHLLLYHTVFWASNHEHLIFKTLCQLPIMNLKQLYLYLTFALSCIGSKPSQAFMLAVARCQEFKSPNLPPSEIFCLNESVIQTVCFLSCSRLHYLLQLNLWANLSDELRYVWT